MWNYDRYCDIGFIFSFLLSSLMGFLLNYSTMICTNYNSPLTTTVVGACKVCFFFRRFLKLFIWFDRIYLLPTSECLLVVIIFFHLWILSDLISGLVWNSFLKNQLRFFSSSAIGSIVYSWVTFSRKSSTMISKTRKGT